MLCNLFWFSFSFAEYSTILIFVTYNAYQMQIQTSCLHPHVVLFLFPILTFFSLKPLTRNHSYIMVYYVFLIRVCDDHSATWHFYFLTFLTGGKSWPTGIYIDPWPVYLHEYILTNCLCSDHNKCDIHCLHAFNNPLISFYVS